MFSKEELRKATQQHRKQQTEEGENCYIFFKLPITVEWQTHNQVVCDNRNPAGRTAEKMYTHHLNHPGKNCKFALFFHISFSYILMQKERHFHFKKLDIKTS